MGEEGVGKHDAGDGGGGGGGCHWKVEMGQRVSGGAWGGGRRGQGRRRGARIGEETLSAYLFVGGAAMLHAGPNLYPGRSPSDLSPLVEVSE